MGINADSVKRVFQELFDALPPGCASLEFSTHSPSGDIVVKLSPTRQGAASIEARVSRDLVYLFFGRGAVFEVPEHGRYTSTAYLEEVKSLCSAVIAGRFRELVKIGGSEVIGASAKVTFETGKVANAVWRQMTLRALKKSVSLQLEYVPYCAQLTC